MNAEEFTEPFDLARFIAGEEACRPGYKIITFIKIEDNVIVTSGCPYTLSLAMAGRTFLNTCFMKPKRDGWIKHDGSEKCPIPWAKAGEYEVKLETKDISSCIPAKDWRWERIGTRSDIAYYRLTDGWIYCNGRTIPKEIEGLKAGEWTYREMDGRIAVSDCHTSGLFGCFDHCGALSDIVAVRPIKKDKALEKYEQHKAEQAMKDSGIRFLETTQQRLTREAYERYKAAHPEPKPVLPLGEDRMNEIAAAALREHDRVWPRKV